MNTKTLPLIAIGIAALAGGLCMQPAQAAPKPAIKKAAPLPEIWQKLTPGQRLQYVRAAELDVYRRLAERACGIQITAESTMRDFVVSSDTLKTIFSNTLKSAEITGINFNDDGTAEVTARLKAGPLIRTIIREKEASGKVLNVSESTEQTVLEETGMGAAPAEGGSSGPAEAPVMREVENIAETVLDMDTVL